jgi:hypothetical protein
MTIALRLKIELQFNLFMDFIVRPRDKQRKKRTPFGGVRCDYESTSYGQSTSLRTGLG